jgi:dihydroneopterin aldolase
MLAVVRMQLAVDWVADTPCLQRMPAMSPASIDALHGPRMVVAMRRRQCAPQTATAKASRKARSAAHIRHREPPTMKLPGDPTIPLHTHRLQIRRCEVDTWIGVYEHEQARRSTLLFDLDLDIDGRQAAASDCIADTVDYGLVVEDVRQHLQDQRHYLVETLADHVADRILSRFSVVRVRVAVAKQAVLDRVASVGVEVERYQQVCTAGAKRHQASDTTSPPSAELADPSMLQPYGPTTSHANRNPA